MTTLSQSNSEYRPDVDGLRAIAVLSVVIFHAFPSALSSGFIGVDIFFVISGYLITGIIFKETKENSFSLAHFYSKRVRRIFPALLLVLFFCLIVGWMALTADEYKQLTRHAAGGAAFINNVVSWRESGYFDNPAETKPLLHLWSLAIEEQFYLFWPIIFTLLLRSTKTILVSISLLLAASLSYSLWKIGVDPVGDFYSPLTRFWELLIGGLLACMLANKSEFLQDRHNLLSIIGSLLVLIGLCLIDKQSSFPGAWALLPTLGAFFLIWSKNSHINKQILSNPVLVWIGLISYPLYLWHWPLLSFARIFEGTTPSTAVRIGLVVSSILIAFMTYKFIEKPIRASTKPRKLVITLSLLMLSTFVVSFYIKSNQGFEHRQYEKLNGDASTLVIGADRSSHSKKCGLENVAEIKIEWCTHDNKLDKPNYALLGDSKGEAIYFGLSRESLPNQSWMMIGPVNFLSGYKDGLNKLAMDRIVSDSEISVVVLSNALRGFTPLNQKTGFIDYRVEEEKISGWVAVYSAAIQRLQTGGKKVVFVIDNPTFPDPNSCITGDMTKFDLLNNFIYRKSNPHCSLLYSDHLAGTAPYQEFLKRLKLNNPELIIYDPTSDLCDIKNNKCEITEGKNFLYSYGDHISDYGSSKIAKNLLPMISKSTLRN